jgi:predicted RNA binding protein YcfA (HicA-like mRNA interferase family)
MAYPPRNEKEWIKALRRLGFEERRVGKGKHAHKFTHQFRHTKDHIIQPDFIIIPHRIYPVISSHIVKELTFFGFSLEEIRTACR